MKDYPVYYAGPAKTPEVSKYENISILKSSYLHSKISKKGYASGSFGPTTSSRMDSYVAQFQENGGSLIMLAKGNRSKEVTNACKKFGGFYLGKLNEIDY